MSVAGADSKKEWRAGAAGAGGGDARRGPRMGRLAFVLWLVLPFVVVLVLWLLIDRDEGKPDPRAEAIDRALLPGQDPATGRGVDPPPGAAPARGESPDSPGPAAPR